MTMSEMLWTPLIEADAPWAGNVSGSTLQLQSPSITNHQFIDLTNGQAGAVFTLDNWSIFHEVQTYAFGPGAGTSCLVPFVAVDESRTSLEQGLGGNSYRTYYLLPSGMTIDTGIPYQFNLSEGSLPFRYPSVVIHDTFASGPAASTGTVTTCGALSPRVMYWNLTGVSVGVPTPPSLGNLTLTVTLPQTTSYEYWFPPHAGIWEFRSTPASGLAFSYARCPT